MAKNPPVVALLSIHPQYAEAILNGEKKVEFRKAGFSKDVTHVVIYATKPIGAVVGVFETDGSVVQSPRELWQTFSAVGGINAGSGLNGLAVVAYARHFRPPLQKFA